MNQPPHMLTVDGKCPHGCDYAKDGDRDHAHRYPPSPPQVGPHEFDRMGRVLYRKLCRGCYLDEDSHPTGWTLARPYGDKTGPLHAIRNTSPALVEQLRLLGKQYGPLGVALAAADLTDRRVLVDRLYRPPSAQPPTEAEAVETAEEQIERLAQFITNVVPGEPSRSEGAVDAAIRIIRDRDLLARP